MLFFETYFDLNAEQVLWLYIYIKLNLHGCLFFKLLYPVTLERQNNYYL